MNKKSMGLLENLAKVSDVRSARISSYDQSGRNQDNWIIPTKQSVVLGDIEGPGCITHMWMTAIPRKILGPGLIDPVLGSNTVPVFEINNALGLNWEITDPFWYRKVLFKITWDNQKHPSVLVPIGDFFCVGHSMPGNFCSLPFSVSLKPEEANKFGAPAALNCYLPMFFNERAKIEIINENDIHFGPLYFYIDYDLYKENLGEDTAYFHAQWRRECPCDGWGADLQVNSPEVNSVANLDGKGNYVILDTEGHGNYIGCNLSVTHFQGTWWGEGDDMIFIDGEDLPSIYGTGSEDYFNHAGGMQKNAFLFNGSIIHENDMPGYQVSYRFHIADPVHFKKSIKVTMEHGHANHLSDDWSSTAYWYQKPISKPFDILPVEKRLPLVAQLPEVKKNTGVKLNKNMEEAIESTNKRRDLYLKEKGNQMKKKFQRIPGESGHSMGNIEHSKRIRNSFK